MDKQPFSSLSLAFQDGSQSRISTRSAAAKKHNSDVTKNLLSAQIEDNLSRLLECLKLEYGKYVFILIITLQPKAFFVKLINNIGNVLNHLCSIEI